MDMDKFQKKALESVAVTGRGINAFAHRTLGLTGEAGAVANRMKKIIRDSDGVISDEDKEYFKLKLRHPSLYGSSGMVRWVRFGMVPEAAERVGPDEPDQT